MKIYAMPADAYPGAVQDIQDWSRGIWGDDHIATTRGLASQIVGRDARIAELEASLDFRTHAREEAGERITELEDERDAAIARLPDGMKHCTIVCEKCEIGHSWLTATNWVEHGCPTCEKNALITRILNLEKAARQIKCVNISQVDAVREIDAAHARADRYGRALKAAVELIP